MLSLGITHIIMNELQDPHPTLRTNNRSLPALSPTGPAWMKPFKQILVWIGHKVSIFHQTGCIRQLRLP